MNEKIKSLAIQSGVVESHVDWENAGGDLLEKFAELIIRECANVAADHDALDIYEEIREHFEVEEYTIEARLDAAKIIIEMRDKYIEELTSQLDDERSNKAWAADQEGFKRMGL